MPTLFRTFPPASWGWCWWGGVTWCPGNMIVMMMSSCHDRDPYICELHNGRQSCWMPITTWVTDDVQPHIRTLVLQPRQEEWQLMELFWKDTIPIPKDTIQFGKPNRNGSLYNMSDKHWQGSGSKCSQAKFTNFLKHGPRMGADYCHLDTSRSSGVWFVTFTLPMMQVDYTTKIFLCCFLCKLGLSWLTNCLS